MKIKTQATFLKQDNNEKSETQFEASPLLETNNLSSDRSQDQTEHQLMQAELEHLKQNNTMQEEMYASQLNQFMSHIKEERVEQGRLRSSLMDYIKENRVLRQLLQNARKKKYQTCNKCTILMDEVKKTQQESKFYQELYQGKKNQLETISHKFQTKLDRLKKNYR